MPLTGMRRFLGRCGGNFFASLIIVLVSGWVAKQAYTMGLGRLHSPGPGFVVFIASVFLGLLALHIFVRSLWGAGEASRPGPVKKRWGRVIWVFLVLVCYVFFLKTTGYLAVTFLGILSLFAVLQEGRKKWLFMVVSAAAISGITYFVFSSLFKLQLPRGWFYWW